MVKQSKVPGYKMIFTKIRDHRFLKLISISLFKFYTCIIQPKKAKFYIGSLREGKAPLVVQVSPPNVFTIILLTQKIFPKIRPKNWSQTLVPKIGPENSSRKFVVHIP